MTDKALRSRAETGEAHSGGQQRATGSVVVAAGPEEYHAAVHLVANGHHDGDRILPK